MDQDRVEVPPKGGNQDCWSGHKVHWPSMWRSNAPPYFNCASERTAWCTTSCTLLVYQVSSTNFFCVRIYSSVEHRSARTETCRGHITLISKPQLAYSSGFLYENIFVIYSYHTCSFFAGHTIPVSHSKFCVGNEAAEARRVPTIQKVWMGNCSVELGTDKLCGARCPCDFWDNYKV